MMTTLLLLISSVLNTQFVISLAIWSLSKLCSCAWTCIKTETQRLLGRDDVVPGMIAGIQTHGELLHWHPHIHALVSCGAFTSEGELIGDNYFYRSTTIRITG